MKSFSAFLEMRCRNWAHTVGSRQHLSEDLSRPPPSLEQRASLLLSTPSSLREC